MSKKGKKMPASTLRSAKALINNLCCNYDPAAKNCLALDDGVAMECIVIATQCACCDYFLKVLLGDKDARMLKAALFHTDNLKECKVCGKPFLALSNRGMYCGKCSIEMQRKQARERMRKQRGITV